MRLFVFCLASHLGAVLVSGAPVQIARYQISQPESATALVHEKRDAVVTVVRDAPAATQFWGRIPIERFMFMNDYVKEYEQVLSGNNKAILANVQGTTSNVRNTKSLSDSPSSDTATRARVDSEAILDPPRTSSAYTSLTSDSGSSFKSGLNQLAAAASLNSQARTFDSLPTTATRAAKSNSQYEHAAKVVAVSRTAQVEPTSKLSYLRDPKNGSKILGASAVSVVASFILGHQIKSNIDTTQQLNEYAARVSAEQQESTSQALSGQTGSVDPEISASVPLPQSDVSKRTSALFRIQRRRENENLISVTKRGNPDPAGVFMAGLVGFAFYRGASAIEDQRAHDRAVLNHEQEYRYRDAAARSLTTNRSSWKQVPRLEWQSGNN